jgi:lactate permease
VVGLAGREGDLIRQTVIPMTYYVLMAGALSYLFVYGLGPNIGTALLVALLAALVAVVLHIRRADARRAGPPSGTSGRERGTPSARE